MSTARIFAVGLVGTLFGFALSRIGFSDWGEVHRMFTFADLRLTLTFGGAVVLIALGLLALPSRRRRMTRRVLHRGVVPGAALFGAGWAITGACPSIALVQVGEGMLLGLLTLAGVIVGTALYRVVHRRFLRFDDGTCGDW